MREQLFTTRKLLSVVDIHGATLNNLILRGLVNPKHRGASNMYSVYDLYHTELLVTLQRLGFKSAVAAGMAHKLLEQYVPGHVCTIDIDNSPLVSVTVNVPAIVDNIKHKILTILGIVVHDGGVC
jgi:hypothetical protein